MKFLNKKLMTVFSIEIHLFPRNSVMEFQNICNEMVAPFFAPPCIQREAFKRSARNRTLVHHRAETFRAEKIGTLSDTTYVCHLLIPAMLFIHSFIHSLLRHKAAKKHKNSKYINLKLVHLLYTLHTHNMQKLTNYVALLMVPLYCCQRKRPASLTTIQTLWPNSAVWLTHIKSYYERFSFEVHYLYAQIGEDLTTHLTDQNWWSRDHWSRGHVVISQSTALVPTGKHIQQLRENKRKKTQNKT